MTIDMMTIRRECAERIAAKLRLTHRLAVFTADCESGEQIDNHGRRDFNRDVIALGTLADVLATSIRDDIWLDIRQYVSLLVRDVLKEQAQASGRSEAVVMLTGNAMFPTYRALDYIELIWQEDTSGEFIHELWEAIERKCQEANVYIDTVEDDGSIYVVDMDHWERSEAAENETVETLNEEWSWIDPEPAPDMPYVLEVETMQRAVYQGVARTMVLNIDNKVRFNAPNKDIAIHTVTDIGRDSDGDVWVKLSNGETLFDWAETLVLAREQS